MDRLERAQGCMLGQLAGDALGSLVEFRTAAQIAMSHPGGPREITGSPIWNTLPGQPTDDSEMALILARMLVQRGNYDQGAALQAYKAWLSSRPFDKGSTITRALTGYPDPGSQANGAMMRISPLGIFGAGRDRHALAEWAEQDAAITHPHPVCREANVLFVLAIADAIDEGLGAEALHARMIARAKARRAPPPLLDTLESSSRRPPAEYFEQMGWIMIALGNAVWQLLHANSLEEAIVDTVRRGGDTDTNAAICGALLGAVYGLEAVPRQWRECILSCRPEAGRSGVGQPRPEIFWPVDVLNLAARLLSPRPAESGSRPV